MRLGFLFFVLCCFSHFTVAQEPSEDFRDWQTSEGVAFEAVLVEEMGDTVRLKNREGKEVTFAVDRLAEADRKFLGATNYLKTDKQQFEMVVLHLEGLHSAPEATIDILKEIGINFKTAPYAPLWGGVALAAAQNDPEPALKQFSDAIRRIREQQKTDPTRHRRTLIAALNNRAICHLKQWHGDAAAKDLIEAMSLTERIPPIILHNARQLIEIVANKTTLLELEDKNRKRLTSVIAKYPPENAQKKLLPGWHYSLDLEVPMGMSNELGIDGFEPIDDRLEIVASGTGLVIAPGHVLTTSLVVVHPSRSASLATIAVPSGKDRWILKPASDVIVTLPRRVAYSEEVISSRVKSSTKLDSDETLAGGEITRRGIRSDNEVQVFSTRTNYRVTAPNPGTTEAELAVLQIPGLRIAPCPLSEAEIAVGKKISILGFRRGPDMLTNGVRSDKGEVLKFNQADPSFLVSARVAGGNRGGPCVDDLFQVVGIAWNTPGKATGAKGQCFSHEDVLAWVSTNVKMIDAVADNLSIDSDKRKLLLKDAIVPVIAWAPRVDAFNPLYEQFFNDSFIADRCSIRDGWCFLCGGDGHQRCPNCLGKGQVQTGFNREVVGQDGRGEVKYQDVPRMEPCKVCQGRRRIPCPARCQGGKLVEDK